MLQAILNTGLFILASWVIKYFVEVVLVRYAPIPLLGIAPSGFDRSLSLFGLACSSPRWSAAFAAR